MILRPERLTALASALIVAVVVFTQPLQASDCEILAMEPGSSIEAAKKSLGIPAKIHSFSVHEKAYLTDTGERVMYEWHREGSAIVVEADGRGEILQIVVNVSHGKQRVPYGVVVGMDDFAGVVRKIGREYLNAGAIECRNGETTVPIEVSCGPEGSTTLSLVFSVRGATHCGERPSIELAQRLVGSGLVRSARLGP